MSEITEAAAGGQIWIPPRHPGGGQVELFDLSLQYGQPITINFDDNSYITASNQVTFTPSLPTGSFAQNTSIGPYYAVSADGFVIITGYDEKNGFTYVYNLTISAPAAPPDQPPAQ